MTRVAIYARYSSDNQRDASIEDQQRLCREHAEQQGWRVVESYADHAISGSSLLRPGVQDLLTDATVAKFDVILAEALDRLSRDQEDIAGLYKRMRFAGVRIVTLSEGEISNLHVGLKGTMNALFLQDLADKTRRGLRGRIEAGKSGGGLCYGYDVIKRVDEHWRANYPRRQEDQRRRGRDRPADLRGIRRSATPAAPLRISSTPRASPARPARNWGPSTIHGNRRRGTGILNNELYIGRLVWNRLRYVKDPGHRQAHLTPQSREQVDRSGGPGASDHRSRPLGPGQDPPERAGDRAQDQANRQAARRSPATALSVLRPDQSAAVAAAASR